MTKLLRRSVPLSLAIVGLVIASSTAIAVPLRAPQVPFNFLPLQTYLNIVDPGINVATMQLDAQVWSVSITGNSDFTLMLKTGLGQGNAVGVYNANDPNPNPPLFQVFPGGAAPGWYAALHFGGGGLMVTLFDQNSIIQGQTFYPGVNANAFGFYTIGLGGLWYSQDARNGGMAQMLTYSSPWLPGDFWLCFEEVAYTPAATFDGVVINVQSIRPVKADATTWGRVKGQYR